MAHPFLYSALKSAAAPMRRIFRFVVLGLVLLLVGIVSMLTAMRLAIHGREVTVPPLVGLQSEQAQDDAGRAGLRLIVESRFFSSRFAPGTILGQSPRPGERVRRGWVIRVAESLGPRRAVVPNVVGESPRAAEMNISRRGLEVGTTSIVHIPGVPPDEIVAQDPTPSAEEAVSPKVNLLVSAPADEQAYVMPDLVGRHFADAAQSIAAAGLHVVVNNPAPAAETAAPPPGVAQYDGATIIHQSPAPGSKVTSGATIVVEVAR